MAGGTVESGEIQPPIWLTTEVRFLVYNISLAPLLGKLASGNCSLIPNPPLKPPFSLGNLSPRLPVSPSPRLSPGKGGSQPGFSISCGLLSLSLDEVSCRSGISSSAAPNTFNLADILLGFTGSGNGN